MGSMITANYDSETDQIIDASPRLNNGVANSSVPVTAIPSGSGLAVDLDPYSDSGYAARSAAAIAVSASVARRDYDDNAAFVEPWAGVTQWTLGASGLQVSGGKAYSVATGSGGGANHSFDMSDGSEFRVVFSVVNTAFGGGGAVIVGVSSDAAGAVPTAGGGSAFGLYLGASTSAPEVMLNGVRTPAEGQNFSVGTWVVTVTGDAKWISVVAQKVGSADEIRARTLRSGFVVRNLYLFSSDSRTTGGLAIGPGGARKRYGTIIPRAGIEGVGYTAHWTGDDTRDWKLQLPLAYDSRVPCPLAILFHGNSSDENHWDSNGNGIAAANALIGAGYAILSVELVGNTTSWGNQASLDAYSAAYKYFSARYALGPVVIYGNSMGGLESLLSIAQGRIPAVCAWAATHPATSLLSAYRGGFTSAINTSYGIASDGSDYDAKTEGHDPQVLGVNAYRKLPMWVLYSTDDATVPAAENAVPFIARVSGSCNVSAQTTTGGHSASVSAFMPSLVAFFNSAVGL